MNIYATGMNPADSNALKRSPRVALFQAVIPMMRTLMEYGEHLTWRATRVGDDLPHDTDAVIVSVMLPRSLNCPYALGAIWAISEALRRELPLVLYLTDWAFFKTHGEFKSIAKAGMPYFSKEIGGSLQYNESPSEIAKHGEELLEVCRRWGDPASPLWERAQILVPRYTNWGDVNIVQRLLPGANPVFTLDPTPVFAQYLKDEPRDLPSWEMRNRTRQWILPSLLKDNTWLDKQNLTWPVERFGPKGFEVLATERDIQLEYQRNVGALCPPYPHAGSGWWRSRWIHSARAGSVLLCDPADGYKVGIPYVNPAGSVERLDNTQLGILAYAQQERMNQLLQLDMDLFTEQVYAPFREAGKW